MRTDIRLGLVDTLSKTKPPVLQWLQSDGLWRVWTMYNPTLTLGTRIVLNGDGSLRRITTLPDGTETLQGL